MSKDTADLNNLPEETPATQTSLDLFNSFLNAPVTKLDADEYTANDLDGITESLIGSGNMNFLMMQAGQTNESMSNANPFNVDGNNASFGASPLFSPNANASAAGADTATDRGFDQTDNLGGAAETGPLNNSSSTAGSLSASNLAASSTAGAPLSDSGAFASAALTSTSSSLPSQNGNNGTDGNGLIGVNGSNGTNGSNGDGVTIIDNTVHLGDTINIIDDSILENVENIYNDTTNLLTEITNNAGDLLTTVVNNAGDVVTTVVNNAGDLLTTIVNDTTNIVDNTTTLLQTVVNDTTSIVNNTVNNVFNGNPLDLGPVGLSLDATVNDLTHLNLDIIHGNDVTNVLNETLNTAPVLAPVGDVAGGLLSSTSLDVLLDPFQYDNSPGDYDLHVGTDLNILGMDIPAIGLDIPLDPVEALLGDLDIGLDLTDDLLGLSGVLPGGSPNNDTDLSVGGLGTIADPLALNDAVQVITNPVEDLAGDIDIGGSVGLDLLGLGSGDTGPDTDISVPVDVDLLGNNILNNGLNIPLDPLESVVGDIDLNLGVATDLLGAMADPVFDSANGGTGTDNILSTIGNGVSNLAGGLIPLNDSGDTDLALNTGIGLLDNTLLGDGVALVFDPVENLTGDIDIAGGIGLDVLGTNDNSVSDTDISIPVDVDFIDTSFVGDSLNISLDPVEAVTGDIDIDLGVAGNVLGNTADDMFDNQAGGTGGDDLLSQAGDGFSDLAGMVLPFDGNNGDSDITLIDGIDLAGMDVLDNTATIALDPVETLTGDVDILSDLHSNLLDIISGGDTNDLSDLNIGFEDIGIIGPGLGADFGSVETITGDIDWSNDISAGDLNQLGSVLDTITQTVDTAVTLLNSSPTPSGGLDLGALGSTLTGAAGDIPSWTETILPDAGSALGGGLAASVTEALADPIATVTNILPVPVPVIPVISGGGLLGGHGGGHHGGLFG